MLNFCGCPTSFASVSSKQKPFDQTQGKDHAFDVGGHYTRFFGKILKFIIIMLLKSFSLYYLLDVDLCFSRGCLFSLPRPPRFGRLPNSFSDNSREYFWQVFELHSILGFAVNLHLWTKVPKVQCFSNRAWRFWHRWFGTSANLLKPLSRCQPTKRKDPGHFFQSGVTAFIGSTASSHLQPLSFCRFCRSLTRSYGCCCPPSVRRRPCIRASRKGSAFSFERSVYVASLNSVVTRVMLRMYGGLCHELSLHDSSDLGFSVQYVKHAGLDLAFIWKFKMKFNRNFHKNLCVSVGNGERQLMFRRPKGFEKPGRFLQNISQKFFEICKLF